jgi:hypothetical protein
MGSVTSNVKSSISTAIETNIGKLKDDICTEIRNRVDSAVRQQMNGAIKQVIEHIRMLDDRLFAYNLYAASDKRAKILQEQRNKMGDIVEWDGNENHQVEIKNISSHCFKVGDTEFNYFSSSEILERIRNDKNFILSSDMLIKTIEMILLMACLVVKRNFTFVIPKLVEVRSDDESMENRISGDILNKFIDAKGEVGKFLLLFFIAKIDDRFVSVIASTAENSTIQIECLEESSQELTDQQMSVLRDCVYYVLGRENQNRTEVSLTFQRKATFPIMKPGKADMNTSMLGIERAFDERDDKQLDYFAINRNQGMGSYVSPHVPYGIGVNP